MSRLILFLRLCLGYCSAKSSWISEELPRYCACAVVIVRCAYLIPTLPVSNKFFMVQ